MKIFVYVVVDGIANAVFPGQVYEPIVQQLENDQAARAYIISFESCALYCAACTRAQQLSGHPRIHILVKRRLPFITCAWLKILALQLRHFLKKFTQYELIARGPLAGVICQQALDKKKCAHLTVQARGLLAQEYRYVHAQSFVLLRLFYAWRARCYERVERRAYDCWQPCPYMVQAVSQALADYVCQHFGADQQKIVLATHDMPALIDIASRQVWRAHVRSQLEISSDAIVYCFCGAAHVWQMPEMTIDYFCQQYAKNNKSFLLILSKDAEIFIRLLAGRVPVTAYKIMFVAHEHIFEYLCAADVGFVFRKHSIMNWVSRPVKAMEYEAAGLAIVHNNTVEWIIARHGINDAVGVFQEALV